MVEVYAESIMMPITTCEIEVKEESKTPHMKM